MTIMQGLTDFSGVESDDAPAWRESVVPSQIVGDAHGVADGDGRAKREARTAVREQGDNRKAQDEAAVVAAEPRADRAALVASVRSSQAAFSARLDASSATKDAKYSDETDTRQTAEECVGGTPHHAGAASTMEASTAVAAYGPGDSNEVERANDAARRVVTTLAEPAGSEVANSGTDRWLDESNARSELPHMGWCTGLADVLAAAYSGDLHADTSGIVRRREGQGRRVRAALVELLASGGYIAVPRAGRRGPVTVTPDGVTAHRWCSAAPDLLHADHRAAYWGRVRVHHTGRTSKQTARDQARCLAPLPDGAEEKRRRAAQMRQVEQWAKEMEATRERLAAEQAEREVQAEQERAAEWARIQQAVEGRQAADDDRRDNGLVMSRHGPEEIIMGQGKHRVTVKRVSPHIWNAVVRRAVYVVSQKGGEGWPWLVIAPDNTRIGVCSVINDAPYAASVRDIVRDHADAMERGETFPEWTPPEETGQSQSRLAAIGESNTDGQTEHEPEPFGACHEDADRTVTTAEPGACDGYGCTATGQRWQVAYLPTSLLCAVHAAVGTCPRRRSSGGRRPAQGRQGVQQRRPGAGGHPRLERLPVGGRVRPSRPRSHGVEQVR
ncbi:hypothetical protein ACLF6K_06060 [Streptomyces xanthophaeus]|uniref:hypothetical protein n=1 Tax=Streptomyces xanthophaeus TaxID=67385 RepID=UPI0039901D8D